MNRLSTSQHAFNPTTLSSTINTAADAMTVPGRDTLRPKRVTLLASSPPRPVGLQRARSYDAVVLRRSRNNRTSGFLPASTNTPAKNGKTITATTMFPSAMPMFIGNGDHKDGFGAGLSGHLSPMPASWIDENRQRQGRLLLVSLLENFCQLYDQSPEQSRRLFFLICRALYHMGIINQEYIDEMAPARASYKRAFAELVAQAATAIQQESLQENRLALGAAEEDTTKAFSGNETPTTAPSSSTTFVPTSPSQELSPPLLDGPTFNFTDLLDVHTSRYRDDFTEIRMLGRGGYGSVWHVRNKLDDCDYAVKKIRLSQNDILLEKVFREIKSMPRLEHPYVVRYYGSWLEHVEYPVRRSRPRAACRGRGRSCRNGSISRLSKSVPSFNALGPGLRIDLLMSTTGESEGVHDEEEEEEDLTDPLESTNDHHSGSDDDVVFHVSEDELSASDVDDSHSRQYHHHDHRHQPHVNKGLDDMTFDSFYSNASHSEGSDYSNDNDDDDDDGDYDDEGSEFDYESDDDGGVCFSKDMDRRAVPGEYSKQGECLPPNATARALPTRFPAAHRRHPSSGGWSMSESTGSAHRFPSSVEDIITLLSSPPNSPPNSSLKPLSMSMAGSTQRNSTASRPHTERALTLFIQMQLCHCTLKDYLRLRDDAICTSRGTNDPLACVDAIASVRLFRRIVEGVAYIHGQGLMHRDLKPSNVFLEFADPAAVPAEPDWLHQRAAYQQLDELIPKIGDFGLVAQMDRPPTASRSAPNSRTRDVGYGPSSMFGRSAPVRVSQGFVSPSDMTLSTRTSGVGTVTYAAPEQLSGNPNNYDAKVDIYALGVIFLELFHPFATLMERAKVLKRLREGVLPDLFVRQYPKEAAFILWLTADPSFRPTAQEILEFDLMCFESTVNAPALPMHVDMLRAENESLRLRITELESRMRGCCVCSSNQRQGNMPSPSKPVSRSGIRHHP